MASYWVEIDGTAKTSSGVIIPDFSDANVRFNHKTVLGEVYFWD